MGGGEGRVEGEGTVVVGYDNRSVEGDECMTKQEKGNGSVALY